MTLSAPTDGCRASMAVTLSVLFFLGGRPSFAADSVSIERLLAEPRSYHLRIVSLRGTAHQIQIIHQAPPADGLLRFDFQCYFLHPAYTFVLADDTGFLQVTVRARPPCVSRFSPAEPPEVEEGDQVALDAQITVAQDYAEGQFRQVIQALVVNIAREGS